MAFIVALVSRYDEVQHSRALVHEAVLLCWRCIVREWCLLGSTPPLCPSPAQCSCCAVLVCSSGNAGHGTDSSADLVDALMSNLKPSFTAGMHIGIVQEALTGELSYCSSERLKLEALSLPALHNAGRQMSASLIAM